MRIWRCLVRADSTYHTPRNVKCYNMVTLVSEVSGVFSRENCNYWLKEIKKNGQGWWCLKRRRLKEKGGKGKGSQCEWANMIYGKDDERDYEKKPISSTVKQWRGTCSNPLCVCITAATLKGFKRVLVQAFTVWKSPEYNEVFNKQRHFTGDHCPLPLPAYLTSHSTTG